MKHTEIVYHPKDSLQQIQYHFCCIPVKDVQPESNHEEIQSKINCGVFYQKEGKKNSL